jgi:hypothetical protein
LLLLAPAICAAHPWTLALTATDFAALDQRAVALGLGLRGAFNPLPGEGADWVTVPWEPQTLVLLGFTGGVQWPIFAASPEAADGRPDPLDRWSRRVISGLANEWGGVAAYPNDSPPLPFQQFAVRCEAVHRSPIGLLIHERWGLWHAYRGVLILPARLALPNSARGEHPCVSCATRPCLSACPVGAISAAGYDVDTCIRHVESAAGVDCRECGCRARRSCPVAPGHRYGAPQMQFHMAAFLAAARRST